MGVGIARRLKRHQRMRWTIAVALVCVALGLVAALAAPAVAGAQSAPSWVKRLSGDGRANATFRAATVNDHGMIYAVGSAEFSRKAGADAVIAKYDPSGKRSWVRHWTSKGKADDTFESVALDSSGNVYAAGRVPAAPSSSTWLFVAKYAADGRLLWTSSYRSSLWVCVHHADRRR